MCGIANTLPPSPQALRVMTKLMESAAGVRAAAGGVLSPPLREYISRATPALRRTLCNLGFMTFDPRTSFLVCHLSLRVCVCVCVCLCVCPLSSLMVSYLLSSVGTLVYLFHGRGIKGGCFYTVISCDLRSFVQEISL